MSIECHRSHVLKHFISNIVVVYLYCVDSDSQPCPLLKYNFTLSQNLDKRVVS